jgi:hypothetical protein
LSDRHTPASQDSQLAQVRHAEGDAAFGVACFGAIRFRAQAEIAGARRADAPRPIRLLAVRASD